MGRAHNFLREKPWGRGWKYRGFLAGGISTASSLFPFFGTRLRRINLAPTQYRQLRRLHVSQGSLLPVPTEREREDRRERTWERGCQILRARNLLKYMSILSCKIIISICLSLRNLYVHIAGWSFYSEAFWPMDVLNLDILKGDKSYAGVSPMANCARIFPLTGPSLNPWAVNTKEWNFSLNYLLTLLIQLDFPMISLAR